MTDQLRKVVIVGAGVSGLACARKLRSEAAGLLEVMLLEARDRPGGRVRTHNTAGMVVDMGGSWIHGLDGNPLAQLLGIDRSLPPPAQAAARVVRTDYRTLIRYDTDGQIPASEMLEAQQLFERLLAQFEQDLPELAALTGDNAASAISLAFERLNGPELTKRQKVCLNYLLGDMESENNSPLHQMSATHLLTDLEYRGGDNHVLDGVEQVLLSAISGSDTGLLDSVLTKQVVQRIQYGADGILLTVEDRNTFPSQQHEIRCDVVVVTTPVSVLQSGSPGITFEPQLPTWKQSAIDACGFGSYNKIVMKWDLEDVFWPPEAHILSINLPMKQTSEGQWVVCDQDAHASKDLMLERHNLWIFNHLPVDGQPMLVAMVSAALALQMEHMGTTVAANRVLAALRIPFPHAPKPAEVAAGRWDLNEFSRGGWSFHRSGWNEMLHDDLVAPVEVDGVGRLFFAGEAMSSRRPGYLDGAFESGLLEAERLLQTCKKSTTKSRL